MLINALASLQGQVRPNVMVVDVHCGDLGMRALVLQSPESMPHFKHMSSPTENYCCNYP